jgi:hypothetical protein
MIVQPREIQQSAAQRLWQRLRGTTPQLPPHDWFYLDRLHWRAYPDRMDSPFVKACIYNTRNHRPDEYETIRQRFEYYRAMSWVLQNNPDLSSDVHAIRFFDATAAVTDSPGVGTLEAPAGALLSREGRQVLVEVNRLLFDMNMRIVARVMQSRALVDPRQQTSAPPDALTFDLRMVETEQGKVEEYLQSHTEQVDRVRNELNDLVNDTRATFWQDPLHMAWAKAAVGVDRLRFDRHAHRIAIGKALVFILHRRPQEEYLRYMRSGQVEYQPAGVR